MNAKKLGKFIVADPEICHGQPTFQGTRILVKTVLAQVARGEDWDTILSDWDGKINEEAISEAVRIASEALIALESVPAPEPEMVAD
ncbi:MAG: DUF433 domain-containing protein [Acidobacteriota bacterium]